MKVLKWIGIVVGALAGIIVIAAVVLTVLGNQRANRVYSVEVDSFEVPTDEASVAEGERLFKAYACTDCHGANGAGDTEFIPAPPFVVLGASNLTSGAGGIGSTYTDEDFIRSIRHGVGPDGRPLIVMPSEAYTSISDDDLGEIIAYVKTLDPVDTEEQPRTVGPLGALALLSGGVPLAADIIDHGADRPVDVPAEPADEFGEYLTEVCQVCHSTNLAGGPIPGAEPGDPPATNLTPHEDGLGSWTEEDFITAIRQGTRPDGTQIDAEYMPWPAFANFNDDELTAMWLYLQTVEPKPDPPVE